MGTRLYYESKDGIVVEVNPHGHIKGHQSAIPYVAHAISITSIEEHVIDGVAKIVIDYGRVIGKCECVETFEGDEIIFKRRLGRNTVSRFVKNRQAVDCQTLVLVIKKQDRVREGKPVYHLLTAYVGINAEREPDDKSIKSQEELDKSVKFWANHALTLE